MGVVKRGSPGAFRPAAFAAFLLAGVLLLLAGCGDFNIYDELGIPIDTGGPVEALAIAPAVAVVLINAHLEFQASGGLRPYSYEIVSGGGTIGAEGHFEAPAVPATVVVRVTDGRGDTAEAQVYVLASGPLTITPEDQVISVNGTIRFQAFGGSPPYTFAVLDPAPTETITPLADPSKALYQAPGSEKESTVRVTDSAGQTDQTTVVVLEPFTVRPLVLDISVGSVFTFSVSGGLPPYTFWLEDPTAGSLLPGPPASGTAEYTAPPASGTDRVWAEDFNGNRSSAEVTARPVVPLQVSPDELIVSVGAAVTFTAGGGVAPYAFDLQSGNTYASITSAGKLTATAPTPLGDPVVVRATDTDDTQAFAYVTVVATGDLAIIPEAVTVEELQQVTFSASGGSPGYTYSMQAGSGSISGQGGLYTAPAAPGTAERVRVTDTAFEYREAIVTVAPAAPTDLAADGSYGGPRDVRLTWTDNSGGEEGFVVERKPVRGSFAEIATLPADVQSFLDTEATPNVLYVYRIRCFANGVMSSYSNQGYAFANQ